MTPKELERFKREYEEMRDFSSPYILEVYYYNDEHNEYIMEYMDYTLDSYIAKFNSELSVSRRKGIVQQILKAIVDGFDTYGILHETFALTRLVYFVMTGKTNIDKISDPKLKGFVSKGLNVDKSKRFQTVNEIIQAFRAI